MCTCPFVRMERAACLTALVLLVAWAIAAPIRPSMAADHPGLAALPSAPVAEPSAPPYLAQPGRTSALFNAPSGIVVRIPSYSCDLRENTGARIDLVCELESPVDQAVLNCLGWDVNQLINGHKYNKIFIHWYLPHYDRDKGAWGITSFVDGHASVQIYRIQDEDELIANAVKPLPRSTGSSSQPPVARESAVRAMAGP